MATAIDMTGKTVNGITVVCGIGSRSGKRVWKCICQCGIYFEAVGTGLRSGSVKGCAACTKANILRAITKHSAIGTKEYITYNAMKSRCTNPKDKRYERYGGRGINICDRWMESFNNFLMDMGPKPSDGHSIERLDVDKGYEPSNCIWATLSEQANNRTNNTRIEIDGRVQNINQWSKESGVNRTVILRRLKRGVSGKQLIFKGVIR